MSDSPFICNLNAMTREQRSRHRQLVGELQASIHRVDELPNGYAARLPIDPSTLLHSAEFITLESLCCPFLGFDLRLSPGRDALSLEFTGPEGVKPFLQAEFGFGRNTNDG